jgi:predicted HTH transcriptional regulator
VKAPKAASKKRGSFEITGDELILRFVKDKGGATTEQIRKHWEASNRGGKSDNNLTNLVKSGKLLRSKDPNGPGSLYTASAEAAAPAPSTTPSS